MENLVLPVLRSIPTNNSSIGKAFSTHPSPRSYEFAKHTRIAKQDDYHV